MRLSVDLILYVIFCGQGRALSLRYDIKFDLILTENNFVFVSFLVRSKPCPTVWYIKFNLRFRPIFEGAVIFRRKMTEGVL